MIRLLLPSLITMVGVFTTLLILYFAIKKYVLSSLDTEQGKSEKLLKTIFLLFATIITVCYIFYVLQIVSVNEIPRAEPDRSAQQKGKQNFEERLTIVENKNGNFALNFLNSRRNGEYEGFEIIDPSNKKPIY